MGLSDTIPAFTPGSALGPVSRTDSDVAFDLTWGILADAGPRRSLSARVELVTRDNLNAGEPLRRAQTTTEMVADT
jgi:hypothetical protein